VKKGTSGPWAAATVNRRLSVLKATAKWAWQVQHLTAENLSPYVVLEDKKKERVRRDTTTQAKVEQMIRAAPDFEAKAYIALGCYGLMVEAAGFEDRAPRRAHHPGAAALPESDTPQTPPQDALRVV
jgi:hypothetical protein